MGRRRRESNEAHMSEEKKKKRKRQEGTITEREREGGVQGERGRDKSKIPRGRKARGMQIKAEREGEIIMRKSSSAMERLLCVAVEAVKYE